MSNPTLKELIIISNLGIEDQMESRLTELAILEGITNTAIKALTLDRVYELIDKHCYLYGTPPLPISAFKLGDKAYFLPTDLGKLEYGQWEDIQVVLKNKQFGKTDWEKFRYLLYIMTSKDYVKNKLSENIEEGSKIFLDVTAKEVLGLISFFQSKEKHYLINTELSSFLMNEIEAH